MNSLKDYINQTKSLIAEEKWQEAYRICTEMLRLDSENSTFIKLKLKIENSVKENNIKAIRAELKKLNPLLQSGQYEEFFKAISPLQTYISDVPEISTIMLKAKHSMDAEILKKQETVYLDQIESFKKQGDQLNYEEALLKLDQFLRLGIKVDKTNSLIMSYKLQWINSELKKNQALLNSQKYEDIIIFLLKLKKINPESGKINNLISRTKKEYQYFRIDSKKDFIFKTIEEIKTLIITKSYDKAIILCRRVLEIDPKNSQVVGYLSKSSKKSEQVSSKLVESQIEEEFQKFPQSLAFKNKNYIRL